MPVINEGNEQNIEETEEYLTLLAEKNEFEGKNGELTEKVKSLEQENEKLKDQELKFGIEIESLNQTINSTEQTFTDLHTEISNMVSKGKEKDQNIEKLKIEVKKLRIELAQSLLAPREPMVIGRTTSHKQSMDVAANKQGEDDEDRRPATQIFESNFTEIEEVDATAEATPVKKTLETQETTENQEEEQIAIEGKLAESEVLDLRQTITRVRAGTQKAIEEDDPFKQLDNIQIPGARDSIRPTMGYVNSKKFPHYFPSILAHF